MIDYAAEFYVTNQELEYIGPAPKTIEEAWEISLAKWKRLAQEPAYDGGSETCGLCMWCSDNLCEHCPIAKYTGHSDCHGTPYIEYLDRFSPAYGHDEWCKLAQRQVEFLQKVRAWWEAQDDHN